MGQTVSTPLYELQNLIPAQTFSSTKFLLPSYSLRSYFFRSGVYIQANLSGKGVESLQIKVVSKCFLALCTHESSLLSKETLASVSPLRCPKCGKTGGCLTWGRRNLWTASMAGVTYFRRVKNVVEVWSARALTRVFYGSWARDTEDTLRSLLSFLWLADILEILWRLSNESKFY